MGIIIIMIIVWFIFRKKPVDAMTRINRENAEIAEIQASIAAARNMGFWEVMWAIIKGIVTIAIVATFFIPVS